MQSIILISKGKYMKLKAGLRLNWSFNHQDKFPTGNTWLLAKQRGKTLTDKTQNSRFFMQKQKDEGTIPGKLTQFDLTLIIYSLLIYFKNLQRK